MDLALVVGGAAGEDAPVLDARLERRPHPQVERIDRLDVVVAVDEDRRRTLGVQPVGVDDRDGRPSGETSTCSRPHGSQALGEPLRGGRTMSSWCSPSTPMVGMRRKST